MEAKMEKIDVNVVKFEVKVEADKFKEALTRAYKKNVKKFNVPGFRKGKVPMNVVKKYYGVEVLLEDAVNFAIEGSYANVLKENPRGRAPGSSPFPRTFLRIPGMRPFFCLKTLCHKGEHA